METTFLLWSASGAATQENVVGTGGVHHPRPTGTLLVPAASGADLEEQARAQPAPAPRPSKKKKPAAAPKRPPQRGLGVEKLERLRLQDRWRKMTEIEPPTADQQILTSPGAEVLHSQHHHHQQVLLHYAVGGQCQAPHSPFGLYNSFPVYDPQPQAGVSRLSLARFAASPAPVGYGGEWGESCFLQQHRLLGAGGFLGSSGAVSPVRSAAFQDHGGVNRFRIAAAETSFQVGSKPSELPSSQSLQCSEECDICIRKRMLEEKLRTTGGTGGSGEGKQPLYLFGAAPDRKANVSSEVGAGKIYHPLKLVGAKGGRTGVKEYEFFPSISSTTNTTITTTYGGGCSSSDAVAFASQTTVGDAPSTSSPPVRSSKQLDLTLKLSC